MKFSTRTRPTAKLAAALVLPALVLAVLPVGGQGADSGVPINHPFVFGLGTGDSNAPETKVYDLRVPIYYPLIPLEDERSWGLRLKLTVFAGVYDFFADVESDFKLRFQSLAATPGVEFLLPAGGGWVLKPFAEIGYARDFDNGLGFGVWSAGLRTLVTWPVGRIDLSLGTKVQFLSSFTSDLDLADDFEEIRIGLDARHPLGFTVGGNPADLSLYVIRRRYVDAVIKPTEGKPLQIEATNEIGLTFGTTPRIKLWFVKLPRIGLGYRWAKNARGIRLNFGFPF
ncbi:MAG: hypothetical protein ACC742_10840 [Thermoanaerobaculales bacterium]